MGDNASEKLGEVYVLIKTKTDQLEKEVKTLQKKVDRQAEEMGTSFSDKFSAKITSSLKKVGAGIAAVFAVDKLQSFIREAVTIAAKAEGIRAAFNKLNRANLLDELRTATRGTVNDVTLMQNAVRASNFQIPLENLAKLFEFAQKRASQTGESVDNLVDSIVLGIARKSIPILDNLGLSAVRIQNEFSRTGDFAKAVGNIVESELTKMGKTSLTTADRIAQINAKFDNMKVVVGEGVIDVFSSFERLASNTYGWLSKIASLPQGLLSKFGIDISDEALGISGRKKDTSGLPPVGSMERLAYEVRKQNEESKKTQEIWTVQGKTVEEIEGRIKQLLEFQKGLVIGSAEHLNNLKEIEKLEGLLNPKEIEQNLSTQLKDSYKEFYKTQREMIEDLGFQWEGYFDWKSEQITREGREMMAAGMKEVDVNQWVNIQLQRLMEERESFFEDGFLPTISSDYGREILDWIEQIEEAFLDGELKRVELQQRLREDMMNTASQFGNELEKAFGKAGDKFINYMNQALQAALRIMDILDKVDSGENSTESGILGIVTSVIGLFGLHKGGSVTNVGGNLSYTPLPKAALGGSFVVPPGFPNDSALVRVESGETLHVTPARQTHNYNADISALIPLLNNQYREMKKLNKNLINKRFEAMVFNPISPTGLVQDITSPAEERLRREGVKFG